MEVPGTLHIVLLLLQQAILAACRSAWRVPGQLAAGLLQVAGYAGTYGCERSLCVLRFIALARDDMVLLPAVRRAQDPVLKTQMLLDQLQHQSATVTYAGSITRDCSCHICAYMCIATTGRRPGVSSATWTSGRQASMSAHCALTHASCCCGQAVHGLAACNTGQGPGTITQHIYPQQTD
jgi:hypothetical protein